MSCCCPPAIAAILCLWVRNGFSKACVAGALTFFPPDPPLYKFLRISKDGELLEDVEDEHDDDKSGEDNSSSSGKGASNGVHGDKSRRRKHGGKKGEHPDEDLEPRGAVAALTDRQKQLEKMAKEKLERDRSDVALGISYKLDVDESLCPPRFAPYLERMEAFKLFNKRAKSYIAVVLYRAPAQELETSDATELVQDNCINESSSKDKEADLGAKKSKSFVESKKVKKTLIYSHGNATDIGGMSLMQCYLARGLEINVIMYDYSGYGESGGTPLEHNTYSDIETVYNYALENLANGDPKNVIFYGQSVGSGPSCYLCSRKPAGGLILHSPFMSGIRVLTPSRALAPLDIFPNIDRIKRVNCPVMIIHGMLDEEVDQSHGAALNEAVRDQFKRDPWWVPDRGHNDICEGSRHMEEYTQRLKTFLSSLK